MGDWEAGVRWAIGIGCDMPNCTHRRFSDRFLFTSKRVVMIQHGWARQIVQFDVADITHMFLSQGVFRGVGKRSDKGTIFLTTKDPRFAKVTITVHNATALFESLVQANSAAMLGKMKKTLALPDADDGMDDMERKKLDAELVGQKIITQDDGSPKMFDGVPSTLGGFFLPLIRQWGIAKSEEKVYVIDAQQWCCPGQWCCCLWCPRSVDVTDLRVIYNADAKFHSACCVAARSCFCCGRMPALSGHITMESAAVSKSLGVDNLDLAFAYVADNIDTSTVRARVHAWLVMSG